MILLTKYKEIEVGQLIREKKDWWIRIEYIEQDDSMMDKYPEKELVLVRVNLISVITGKPHGSCTKSYQEIIDLINKPVETTNEQPNNFSFEQVYEIEKVLLEHFGKDLVNKVKLKLLELKV